MSDIADNITGRLKRLAPDYSSMHGQSSATVLGTDVRPSTTTTAPSSSVSAPPTPVQDPAGFADNYVARWESLSDQYKMDGAYERLGQVKRHYGAVSSQMNARDTKEYEAEFEALHLKLETAKSKEDVRNAVYQMGVVEASYSDVLNSTLHQQATQDVNSIEKALPVSRSVMPEEHVNTVRTLVASAKNDLATATTPEHYDAALDKLHSARAIQQGRYEGEIPHVDTSAATHTDTHTDAHADGHDAPLPANQHNEVSKEAIVNPSTRDPNNPKTWGMVFDADPCPCGTGLLYKNCHKKLR